MTSRDDYPLLARIERRHIDDDDCPDTVRQLTFALDEIDRLRQIRQLARLMEN